VSDQQQTPVHRHRGHRIEGLHGVEATRERRVGRQPGQLLPAPSRRRQLRGLARAHPGAEQHRVERRLHTRQGDPGRARLLLAPLGQAALGVRACAMRLGLRVTK